MKKNNFIEFFRFISAMIVFLFHAIYNLTDCKTVLLGKKEFQPLFRGWICVEFFFILTGFFLARQAKKDYNSGVSVGDGSIKMLKKKAKRIFPCHIYAFAICFFLNSLLNQHTFYKIISCFHKSIPNLFLLNLTGIRSIEIVRNEWFLSAMMIVIALIYPVLLKSYDFFKPYFCVLPILIYGYLLTEYRQLSDNLTWIGLGYKGVFRAAAGILLGCFAFELCNYFTEAVFSETKIALLHITEIAGFLSLLIYTSVNTSENEAVIVAILTALAVSVSFSDKGLLKKVFHHPCFAFLGELSFPIYMCESIGYRICKHLINRGKLRGNIIILVLDTIITLSFSLLFVFLRRLYHTKKRSESAHTA